MLHICRCCQYTQTVHTFVLLEPVYQNSHPIVPKLYAPIVQRRRQQRLSRVECESCRDGDEGNMGTGPFAARAPFTRLLLDSNFVSITDMVTMVSPAEDV